MGLSLEKLIDHVEHAVGGQTDARIDPVAVVNQAGNYLTTMAPWPWLERPDAGLDFVAAQPWLDLPADFEHLLNEPYANSSVDIRVRLATLDQLSRLRAQPGTVTFDYYVALEYPPQAAADLNPAGARLALYPTPASSAPDQIRINYRAGWRRLMRGDDVTNTPSSTDALLLAIVRIFARGYENDDDGKADTAARLKVLEDSPLFTRLIEHYSLNQANSGLMEGGIVSRRPNDIYRPYATIERS